VVAKDYQVMLTGFVAVTFLLQIEGK
jgi:hypothetical protein